MLTQPYNLRFILEDLFTEKDTNGKYTKLNPNNRNMWESNYCNHLERSKNKYRLFIRPKENSSLDPNHPDIGPIFKYSKLPNKNHPTVIQSEFIGNGYAIANALRYGFNTDLDVAKRLHISKRTADRIMHPAEKCADTRLHFSNVITIKALDDDYQYHWVRRKSEHPDKYHKWDWKLKKNNIIGKYKPQVVVDEHTFNQYRITYESPLQRMIHKHYGKNSRALLLQVLYNKERLLTIQKYKLKIMSRLISLYKGNKVKHYHSFSNYLASLNRIYVSLVYKVECLNHNKSDWEQPIKATHFANIMRNVFFANNVLKISPITLSLNPTYYVFNKIINQKVTSAMLYWYLYTKKKYYLIPYSKQFILHKVWMELYNNQDKFNGDLNKLVTHPDTNPNIIKNFSPETLFHSQRLSDYINHWKH